MSVTAAILNRWNDASLDTSICAIFRTHPRANAYGSTPEDIAAKNLPRAQFMVEGDIPVEHTVGKTLREHMVTFEVWHSDPAALETALDLIESTYDNSERAGTDPLTVSNGSVIRVQYSGRESGPVDENVFLGSVEFEVEWQKDNSVPA
jgi:hypothetical protein